MDTTFFDSQSLFESQEFNFESLLSYDLGEDSYSDVKSSPSLTSDESVFDSPGTSPGRQDPEGKNIFYIKGHPIYTPDPISFEFSPLAGDVAPPVEVKKEFLPPPTTMLTTPPVSLGSNPPATNMIKESEEDDEELGKRGTKRTRKRRKMTSPKNMSVTNDRNTVVLTREELLNFSSEQFEEFVGQVTDVRELTPNEKNEIKRQRRLIKNRESAHASRQRKKSHIDELERRVKELTNENSLLKENLTFISNENSQLKNDVVFLQAVVNKGGMNLLGRGASYLSTLGGGKQSQLQPNSIPATSLVLMIVLFSFGLFLNFGLSGQKPQYLSMEPLPDVIKSRVFQQEEYEATAQSQNLLDVLAEQEVPVHRLEEAYRRHLARDSTKEVLRTIPSTDYPDDTDTLTPQEPPASSFQSTSHKIEIEPSNTPMSPSSLGVSVVSRPQILHWKPNTTYLLCENVSQMLPPVHVLQNPQQEDNDNSPMISFLIPPDALGGVGCKPQMESMDSVQDNDTDVPSEWNFKGYLEVTCQVLDMNFLANDTSQVC